MKSLGYLPVSMCQRWCIDHFAGVKWTIATSIGQGQIMNYVRFACASNLILFSLSQLLTTNHHSTLPTFQVAAHIFVHCMHMEPTILQGRVAAVCGIEFAHWRHSVLNTGTIALFLYTHTLSFQGGIPFTT